MNPNLAREKYHNRDCLGSPEDCDCFYGNAEQNRKKVNLKSVALPLKRIRITKTLRPIKLFSWCCIINCTKLGSSAGDMLKYSYRNFSIKPPKGLIVCKHFRRRGGGGAY